MPTGVWHRLLLLVGHNCKLWMPAKASNITEAQDHDEHTFRGGRSVTGVHRSLTGIQDKSVTEEMEKRMGAEV